MDENKLAELFKDAVRDAPPSSFDAGDVRAASHRAAVRQRSVLLGSTMAAVVLVGGVALGTGLFSSTSHESATSASANDTGGSGKVAEQAPAPYEMSTPDVTVQRGDANPQNDPGSSSMQGVEPPGSADPTVGGTPSGCGTVDRELANALAGELSVAPDKAAPAGLACPVGSKSASFDLADGRVYAVVVPGRGTLSTPDGAALSKRLTKNGSTLYVVSEAPSAAGKVDSIAAKLGGKF
ncbi:hypothetical protein [Umezawaea sp. NPDC059074]|uniref:hypothetical protein n=1 Tax=Umezawaea sp. NPDC059074 TaxID=3346716 RepID=UPI0036A8368D